MRNSSAIVALAAGGLICIAGRDLRADCPTDVLYTTALDFDLGGFGINVNTASGDQLEVNGRDCGRWINTHATGTYVSASCGNFLSQVSSGNHLSPRKLS